MTIHIEAEVGEIAETVLMPGDPLRAKFIAENFLEGAKCHNKVRGMYGYTGTYKGKKVSVQGSGMGMPSMLIYANELISTYGAKKLIRIGTCGALQNEVNLRDVVIGQAACTDSAINRITFDGMDFSPIANFELLKQAYEKAAEKGMTARVGNIISSDVFYDDRETWKLWGRYGVLAVEMETAALYTLGAKYGVKTLALLTVSDHLLRGEACSSEERQTDFNQMMEIALEIA